MARKSLSDAGIGWRPPFVRAEQIADRPFDITHAEVNPNGYGGKPELYCQLALIPTRRHDPLYDADGNVLTLVSWSASLTPSRADVAKFFEANPGDVLGPLMFEFVQGKNLSNAPFAQLVDYQEFAPIAAPTQARSVPARNGSYSDRQRGGAPRAADYPQPGNGRGSSGHAVDDSLPWDESERPE